MVTASGSATTVEYKKPLTPQEIAAQAAIAASNKAGTKPAAKAEIPQQPVSYKTRITLSTAGVKLQTTQSWGGATLATIGSGVKSWTQDARSVGSFMWESVQDVSTSVKDTAGKAITWMTDKVASLFGTAQEASTAIAESEKAPQDAGKKAEAANKAKALVMATLDENKATGRMTSREVAQAKAVASRMTPEQLTAQAKELAIAFAASGKTGDPKAYINASFKLADLLKSAKAMPSLPDGARKALTEATEAKVRSGVVIVEKLAKMIVAPDAKKEDVQAAQKDLIAIKTGDLQIASILSAPELAFLAPQREAILAGIARTDSAILLAASVLDKINKAEADKTEGTAEAYSPTRSTFELLRSFSKTASELTQTILNDNNEKNVKARKADEEKGKQVQQENKQIATEAKVKYENKVVFTASNLRRNLNNYQLSIASRNPKDINKAAKNYNNARSEAADQAAQIPA